jgi:putative methyltransferase (TIGR04325 family)
MKALLRKLAPPAALRWWRRRRAWKWFAGDFATWAEARAQAVGYEDAAVLTRVRAAARAVRAGEAAWDRDGATFAEPTVHAPLLAALRAIGAEHGGRLDVVDFGGALGSTWWQYRAACADLAVRWCVVEQPHFVAAGREEFTGGGLSFARTLAEAGEGGAPAVILFSGVLSYLENPRVLLAEAAASGVRHVIIDRTPFWGGGRDWLTVQRTHPELGGGSYPAWVFDRAKLLAPLVEKFEVAAEWPGFDVIDPRLDYRGLHLVRKAVST